MTANGRAAGRQPRPRMLLDPGHFLALGGGTGLAPIGPGTAGTAIAVLVYWPLCGLAPALYLGAIAVLFLAGIPLCARTARALQMDDHPAIVWDEVVGFLIAMALVEPGIATVIGGFILFRLFDIFKPWPISYLDRHVHGGTGIMLDDALAGIFSAIVLATIEYLSYI